MIWRATTSGSTLQMLGAGECLRSATIPERQNKSRNSSPSQTHEVQTSQRSENGLAPQRRHQLGAMAAKAGAALWFSRHRLRHEQEASRSRAGGSVILQHVHTVWKIYHSFDESKQHLFRSTWNTALGALLKAKHRWQVVTGPLRSRANA